MPPKPAILKKEPLVMRIHVRSNPPTAGDEYPAYLDNIRQALARECRRRGIRGIDDPVMATAMFCLGSQKPVSGQIIGGPEAPVDIDNLPQPFLRLLKQAEGGPLTDNAHVVVADLSKNRQRTGGSILEVRVIDDSAWQNNPVLKGIDHRKFVKTYSLYSVLKPAPQCPLPAGISDTLDFKVPGRIFPEKAAAENLRPFMAHILETARLAAVDCCFPQRIPRQALLHITMGFCYADRAQAGQFKMLAPDLIKLVKPTVDALRDDRPTGETRLMEDDDQGVHYFAFKAHTRDQDAVYIRVQIIHDPDQMRPPEDIAGWMATCDVRHERLKNINPIIIPSPSVPGIKAGRRRDKRLLAEARA